MNKKKFLIIFFVSILACLCIVIYTHRGGEDLTKAYGNIDIRQSYLTFERNGRLSEVLAEEGDMVKKGQILARIDTKDLEHQIAIRSSQCDQEKALLDEAVAGYRKDEIAQAKAAVERLTQAYELSVLSNTRLEKLFKKNSVSEQEKDSAHYQMTQTKAQLDEAKARYQMLKEGVRTEQKERAKAAYETCLQNLDYLKYQKDEQSVLVAPFDGIIRTRKSEPGDMVSPLGSVFELSMIDLKRARIYLTELQLHYVKVGDKVTITTASKDEVEGTIAFISPTAMFTPKNVQTEDLRPTLVYEVRVDAVDTENVLRLGQPITVHFAHE